jgi:hypothetical protein
MWTFHSDAGSLLGFDLTRCAMPMFLVPPVGLALRLPKRVGALLDSPLLFGIHPRLPKLYSLQPNLCRCP